MRVLPGSNSAERGSALVVFTVRDRAFDAADPGRPAKPLRAKS
jgi:hypothetical protein